MEEGPEAGKLRYWPDVAQVEKAEPEFELTNVYVWHSRCGFCADLSGVLRHQYFC